MAEKKRCVAACDRPFAYLCEACKRGFCEAHWDSVEHTASCDPDSLDKKIEQCSPSRSRASQGSGGSPSPKLVKAADVMSLSEEEEAQDSDEADDSDLDSDYEKKGQEKKPDKESNSPLK